MACFQAFIILILLSITAPVFAGDAPAASPQAMIDLAHLGLSPDYSSTDRKAVLQTLQNYLKANETSGLKKTNPSKFSEVYTAYTLLHEYSMVSGRLKDCGETGGLGGEVLDGIQGYSKSCSMYRHLYMTWKTQKTGEQSEAQSIPAYLYGHFYGDVEQVSSRLLFDPDEDASTPAEAGQLALLPKVAEVKSKFNLKSDQDSRNLAGKLHLRGEMLIDSISNPIENIVRLQKGFQNAMSDSDLSSLIATSCPTCDLNQQNKIKEKVNKAASRQPQIQPKKMAKDICQNLKDSGYFFGSIDAEVSKADDTETLDIKSSGGGYEVVKKAESGVAYTQIYKDPYYGDQVHVSVLGEQKKAELRASRVSALKAVAEKMNLGSIVLTPALTALSEKQPFLTKLDCDHPESDENVALFTEAADQAKASASSFIQDLNSKLSKLKSPDDVDDDLALLVEVAPKSASHALMDHPAMTPWICNAIHEVGRKKRISEFKEESVMWGSTVVGGALLVSGVAAPAGAALLSFSTIASAAVATTSAGYLYHRALVHEEDSQFLYEAALAQNDTQSLKGSQADYKRFRELELNTMMTLGMSALDFVSLAKIGLSSAKSLKTVNSVLDEALKNPKWTAEIKGLSPEAKLKQVEKIFEDVKVPDPKEKIILKQQAKAEKQAEITSSKLANEKLQVELKAAEKKFANNKDAVEMLNSKNWARKVREAKISGKGEPLVELPNVEQARSYVYDFPALKEYGFGSPNSLDWSKVTARLEKSSLNGKNVGWERKLENGNWARVRLDFEPNVIDAVTGNVTKVGRGGHYNIEMHVRNPDTGVFETQKLAVSFNCGANVCNEAQVLKIAETMNQ